MSESKFAKYVHAYEDPDSGNTRYAVGLYSEGQYVRTFDSHERKLTGCSAEYGAYPWQVQNYATRRQALRRARTLYADTEASAQWAHEADQTFDPTDPDWLAWQAKWIGEEPPETAI